MNEYLSILKNRLIFIVFHKLYRITNGWGLSCYEIYWKALKELENHGIM